MVEKEREREKETFDKKVDVSCSGSRQTLGENKKCERSCRVAERPGWGLPLIVTSLLISDLVCLTQCVSNTDTSCNVPRWRRPRWFEAGAGGKWGAQPPHSQQVSVHSYQASATSATTEAPPSWWVELPLVWCWPQLNSFCLPHLGDKESHTLFWNVRLSRDLYLLPSLFQPEYYCH